MGALITLAILDLQLAAAFTCRWDLDTCDRHARDAVALAQRLGLHQIRAKALTVLAGSAGMRADAEVVEHYAAQAMAADPDDRAVEGICWAARGTALLLGGDGAAAVDPFSRGMDILARLPNAEPAGLRALWPLLLAARRPPGRAGGQGGAAAGGRRYPHEPQPDRLRRSHPDRAGRAAAAGHRAGRGQRRGLHELRKLGRAGPAVRRAGRVRRRVGRPGALADQRRARIRDRGLDRLAGRCRELRNQSQPNPWVAAGITAREAEVLRLVADGLPNKEIAARLHLSPRTVEKHVESLLRKTGARSRTSLAAAHASR